MNTNENPQGMRTEDMRTEEQLHPQFEAALRRAMQPVKVPAEVSARLLAIAAGPQLVQPPARAKVLAFPQRRMWFGGAIAAMLLLGVLAGDQVHQHHVQQVAQQRATQQFETAEQITDQALDHARQQVERAERLSLNTH